MMRRLVVYLGLATAVVAVLLVHRQMLEQLSPPAPVATPAARPDPAAGMRLPAPCLVPDARLLQAVGDVHRILTGRPFAPAVARFEGGEWHIAHRGVEVGAVPELPDFDDLTRLLSGWALRLGVRDVFPSRRNAERPATARQQLDAMQAVLAASECDRLASGGGRDAELLKLGARALVVLELETTDGVGIADRVAARALALVSACPRTGWATAPTPGRRPKRCPGTIRSACTCARRTRSSPRRPRRAGRVARPASSISCASPARVTCNAGAPGSSARTRTTGP